MKLFKKLFQGGHKQHNDSIMIYLDSELKKCLETKDQTVRQYTLENNFEEEQFLYLMVRGRKTGEIILKKRINHFERLSQCLFSNEQYKTYIVVGYGAERSTIPRISAHMPRTQSMKFTRSGTLSKYNDQRNAFEECQLKLHHDYLTFYKFKETVKELSFVPLENSVVEIVNEKKHMFAVKDKFNQIIFKTSSREDMFSWLLAITEAIKICNSEIYMSEMQERLVKAIRTKLSQYISKCSALKDHSKVIPLDDMGRKALRAYFERHPPSPLDQQLLQLVEDYLTMCKQRREKGEAHSQPLIAKLKENISNIKDELPGCIEVRDLSSKNQFVKTIEQTMKYLDSKYRKEIVEKRNVHQVFKSHLLEQYRQDRPIKLLTLFGHDPNKPVDSAS